MHSAIRLSSTGAFIDNTVEHELLPYIILSVGASTSANIRIKAVKDSGSSHTLMDHNLWNHLPAPCQPKLYPSAHTVTFGNTEQRSLIGQATFCLTFHDNTNRPLSLRRLVYIVANLKDDFYIGNDCLSGPNYLLETEEFLFLTSVPKTLITFTTLDDNRIYHIPVLRGSTQAALAAAQSIQIPPRSQIHTPFQTDTTLFQRINLHSCALQLPSMVPYTATLLSQNTLQLTNPTDHWVNITNGQDIAFLTPQRSSSPLPSGTKSFLERQLRKDASLSVDEITSEVRKFRDIGRCHPSASFSLATNPKLQSFRFIDTHPLSEHDLIRQWDIAHLTPTNAALLSPILHYHIDIFARHGLDFLPTTLLTAHIELNKDQNTVASKNLPIPWHQHRKAAQLIDLALHHNIVIPTNTPSPFVSHLMFDTEPDGSCTAYLDSRILNINSVKMPQTLLPHDEITALLANRTHMSTLELANPFLSIPLDVQSAHLTSFYDHKRRRLCLTSVPQGWVNAQYYLDTLLRMILRPYLHTCYWIDSKIIVATPGSFSDHIQVLDNIMLSLRKANLKLWADKILIDQPYVDFLGLWYAHDTFSIPQARVQGFLDLPQPKTPAQLRLLLNGTDYYSRFIPNYHDITDPIRQLLLANTTKTVLWSSDTIASLTNLFTAITTTTSLHYPQHDRLFVCHSDASSKAISFVVHQEDDSGNKYPIAFLSRPLSAAERKLSTFQKEAIALLYGLTAMNFFFKGTHKIRVLTDAKGLIFLRACRGSNPALAKIALTLSAYSLEIFHIAGKDNVTSDLLSRANIDIDNIDDDICKHSTAMTEPEALAFVHKIRIPEGRIFSVQDVRNILQGQHLPSMTQKRSITSHRLSPFVTPLTSLPIVKPTRRIKMPRLVQRHHLYPSQRADLAKQARLEGRPPPAPADPLPGRVHPKVRDPRPLTGSNKSPLGTKGSPGGLTTTRAYSPPDVIFNDQMRLASASLRSLPDPPEAPPILLPTPTRSILKGPDSPTRFSRALTWQPGIVQHERLGRFLSPPPSLFDLSLTPAQAQQRRAMWEQRKSILARVQRANETYQEEQRRQLFNSLTLQSLEIADLFSSSDNENDIDHLAGVSLLSVEAEPFTPSK